MTARLHTLYQQLKTVHRQIVLTQGEKLVRALEDWIAHYSLIENNTFFDPDQFAWVKVLESNWMTIRNELDDLLNYLPHLPNFQDISSDQYSITQDDRWKTYFFYAYGLKAETNCAICPRTTQLIEQIPDLKTAFFSILLPQKRIPEHRGPYKGVLRYHLGLKVPQQAEKCGIRVDRDVRHWQEGKSLIFDDTFPHAAWNDTDEVRVVLFLDVVRPLRFPASLLNQVMIQLIAWSPYIQNGKSNFKAWERHLNDTLMSPASPK